VSERGFLPVLVLAQAQNHAEKINSLLRSAGHPVRSTWVGNLDEAEIALTDQRYDLIFCFTGLPDAPLDMVAGLRDEVAKGTPLIAIAKSADEAGILDAINKGARDLVSVDNPQRLEAVVVRELGVLKQARALGRAEDTIRGFQSRFESLLSESGDAIGYFQDGIHVSANPAWLERFGYASMEQLEGIPVMDLFSAESQKTLKDAMRDLMKGKAVPKLELKAVTQGGEEFDADVEMRQVEMDGEAAVEIAIRQEADTSELEAQMAEVARRDPLSGLYHRHHFVDVLSEEVQRHRKGAARALVFIKPDKFSLIEDKVGPLASDHVLKLLGELIAKRLAKHDTAARFGGNIFAALVLRHGFKEIEQLAADLVATVGKTVFEAGGQSTSMTLSVGIADFAITDSPTVAVLISHAQQACRQARQAGGNRAKLYEPPVTDKDGKLSDAGWVKQITNALKTNRFQLVYQPIASLQGDESQMFDVLVRMLGDDNSEIMPGDFIPPAVRNGLMVGIDRWIMDQAFRIVTQRSRDKQRARFFVRVSDQSLTDATLVQWIQKGLQTHHVPAGAMVFQVAEQSAAKYLKETKALAEAAKDMRCGVAIEHFGVGHDPLRLFDHVRPDFVKIDGSFMARLGSEPRKDAVVQAIIEKAAELQIETIAERVENANTMALLFGFGVSYIQGNYVQEPEVIMAENARVPT
jgi:diguanylate cyclase (GGDEF)-like protein/PAS domain S-box-containing protein